MPVYTFGCLDCEREFEFKQSVEDYSDGGHHCPYCGSANIERRLDKDLTTFTLKGDGWTK